MRYLLYLILFCLIATSCVDFGDPPEDDTDDGDNDGTPGEVWDDTSSGLMWQNYDCCYNEYSWSRALNYCEALSLGGYDDWRLPTISELRSLIRGCNATKTGGSCDVDDTCLNFSCLGQECSGCKLGGGPADNGLFFPPELYSSSFCTSSDNEGYYESNWSWSSSSNADDDNYAWIVWFDSAHIDRELKNYDVINCEGTVRCVR